MIEGVSAGTSGKLDVLSFTALGPPSNAAHMFLTPTLVQLTCNLGQLWTIMMQAAYLVISGGSVAVSAGINKKIESFQELRPSCGH